MFSFFFFAGIADSKTWSLKIGRLQHYTQTDTLIFLSAVEKQEGSGRGRLGHHHHRFVEGVVSQG